MKRISPFSREAKEFMARATHAHCVAGEIEYWGDGRRVLLRSVGYKRHTWAEVREPGDVLWHGEEFRYSDHFLPENRL